MSPFVPEKLFSRDGFRRQSRVSLLILHSQAGSVAYSWDSSRFPRWRPNILSTASGSVPSLSVHAIAYRWGSLPRVRRHRAISPQGSSSNGCCLFRYHHGLIIIPFILDVRLMDAPAGVTHEEGYTGFLRLPSAVLALIFIARRIQPSLSLVGRQVELCVPTN